MFSPLPRGKWQVQCTVTHSAADPDPGSGALTPGSGIRCLCDPWIRDPGWVKSKDPDPGSGMNNSDHIS